MAVPGGLNSCSDHDTGWNGLGRFELVFFDRHNVACPTDTPVMTQWKINAGSGSHFKVDYTCCRTSMASQCHSATSAEISDNNGLVNTDGLVFTATNYMQTCGSSEFMSRWQMARADGRIHLDYECCTLL
eukprot:SAG22_NODE_9354_length_594_cov_0.664646_1_plen_130_part_00